MDIRVAPNIEATHDILLSGTDGEQWAFKLAGGPAGVQESSITPSTLAFNKTGSKFGDWEPGMSHVEQRDWSGGRGQEYFVDDPSKFYDSRYAFTTIPGWLMPSFRWWIATGLHATDYTLMQGTVHGWHALYGAQRFISKDYTPTAAQLQEHAHLWIRRVGTPGTLTLELRSDSAGSPSTTVLKSKTLSTTDITDVLAEFYKFSWASAWTATGNKVHLVIYGAATDNLTNHWEVGANDAVSGSNTSTDGITWAGAKSFSLYYHASAADADLNHKFWRVYLNGVPYLVVVNGSNTYIYPFTATGLGTSVATVALAATDCVAVNNFLYFAFGKSNNIRRLYLTGGVWTWATDETVAAEHICYYFDPKDKGQIWISSDNTVRYATVVATWTALTGWSTALAIGESGFNIIGITSYNNKVYVRKGDSLWAIQDDIPQQENIDLTPSIDSVCALDKKDLFLYFTWSHSVERYYSGTVDDTGLWKGTGLPNGRSGNVSCLYHYIGWEFAGVDAGASGTSGVYLWDDRGWHEIWRAPETGDRVCFISSVTVSSRNYLLIGTNNHLYMMDIPTNVLNPLHDSALRFHHEAVLTSSAIDMGYADLPKFFKDLTVISRNLSPLTKISVDYQVDDEIGDVTWNMLDTAVQSPKDVLPIRRGGKRSIRFRFRLISYSLATSALMNAAVLKGFGRTPAKRQWVLKVQVGTLQRSYKNEIEKDPNDLYKWLWNTCQEAQGVRMSSVWSAMHDTWVVVEPPNLIRSTLNKLLGWWTGTFQIVLREI